MTIAPYKALLSIKTKITLLAIFIFAFNSFMATSSGHSSTTNTSSYAAGQQADTLGQPVIDPNASIPTDNSSTSLQNNSFPQDEASLQPNLAEGNESSLQPSLVEGASLEDGGLLTDPSYPISSVLSPDRVQTLKPSNVVSNELLTASSPSPTPRSNSSLYSGRVKSNTSHAGNETQNYPVLNGSMTIALPTTTMISPVSPANPTPYPSISLSSLSPSTVIGFVTANASMTPTTSTAVVYATNSPAATSRPSNTMKSSCSHTSTSPLYSLMRLGLLVILIGLDYL